MKRLILKYTGLILLIAIVLYIAAAIVPYGKKIDTGKLQSPSDLYAEHVSFDRAALVDEPFDAYTRRMEIINSAQHTLELSGYSVYSGWGPDRIYGALLNAADRGVHIRIIFDHMFGEMKDELVPVALALSAHENIRLMYFNPIDITMPQYINFRLHDKYLIADDRLLLIGGRNIGDKYFAPEGYGGNITQDRDVMIFNSKFGNDDGAQSVIHEVRTYFERITDSDFTVTVSPPKAKEDIAKALAEQSRLLKTFQGERIEELTLARCNAETLETGGVSFCANPIEGTKKVPIVMNRLFGLAAEAKDTVIIQSPYTLADKDAMEKVRQMTAGGARFMLLTNSLASSPNIPGFSVYLTQRDDFMDAGLELYEYQPKHSLHTKSMIVDGRFAAIGSWNMDCRSMYIDTETMLIIDCPQLCDEILKQIDTLMSQALKVGDDNKYEPGAIAPAPVPFTKKALFRVAGVFTRLLKFLM